jgi:hypothetical protein
MSNILCVYSWAEVWSRTGIFFRHSWYSYLQPNRESRDIQAGTFRHTGNLHTNSVSSDTQGIFFRHSGCLQKNRISWVMQTILRHTVYRGFLQTLSSTFKHIGFLQTFMPSSDIQVILIHTDYLLTYRVSENILVWGPSVILSRGPQ